MKTSRIVLTFLAASLGVALLALVFLPVSASTARMETAPQASLPWRIECADCPPQFSESSDRMLRLDSGGNPHLAYGRDHLYYAWLDGDTWRSETVDPAYRVGTHAALALDGAATPHISYFDALNRTLKFARREASGWQVLSLGAADDSRTSLALDSAGYPHISYRAGATLKYAYQDPGGWHFETADSAPNSGWRSSLALDSSGVPHISYWDAQNTDLKYAARTGGVWQTTIVEGAGNFGEHSSIAVDAAGNPHISYYQGLPEYNLKYARLEGSLWVTATVDTPNGVGTYNAIALDGSAYPHISYQADNTLRYAYLDASGWHTATLESGGLLGGYTSIALDAAGQAHIAYYDTTLDDWGSRIKYARQVSGVWQISQVVSGAAVGAYTSLALDEDDFAHISYQDITYDDLKYAYQSTDGWHVQTLDWSGRVGACSALKLDGSGYPHIAYHEITHNRLKYIYQTATGWQPAQVIDLGVETGCVASLDLDPGGYPHLSYYDSANRDLKYAYRDASGWQVTTLESGGDVGLHSSLALDSQGYPHISYVSSSQSELRYAYLDVSGWHTATIDSAGSVGWFSSLALDAGERPWIAYRDDSNRDLKLARHDGSGWQTGVVDPSGDTGGWPSLALDVSGTPHISYTGDLCPVGSCGRLKYAVLGVSGWLTETIPAPGANYGFDSSIALRGDGTPRISFDDRAIGDLKLATTPVGVESISLSGSLTGTMGSVYTFTAAVTPPDASLPVTYTFQASDQAPAQVVGGTQASITYTWNAAGVGQILVSAENLAGLVTATHTITITDLPIDGLVATNDGPTRLGSPTTLSASIQSGSGVSYVWDFGDGETASGAIVTHAYLAPGTYTAKVIAGNTAGVVESTTQVRVYIPMYLPLVPRN